MEKFIEKREEQIGQIIEEIKIVSDMYLEEQNGNSETKESL